MTRQNVYPDSPEVFPDTVSFYHAENAFLRVRVAELKAKIARQENLIPCGRVVEEDSSWLPRTFGIAVPAKLILIPIDGNNVPVAGTLVYAEANTVG